MTNLVLAALFVSKLVIETHQWCTWLYSIRDFVVFQTEMDYSAQKIQRRISQSHLCCRWDRCYKHSRVLYRILVYGFEKLPVAAWCVHTSGSILAAQRCSSIYLAFINVLWAAEALRWNGTPVYFPSNREMKQTMEPRFNIVSKHTQTTGCYQHSFPYEAL